MHHVSSDRNRTFLLSATVDFPDDVLKGVYTHEVLDDMMAHLKRLGVQPGELALLRGRGKRLLLGRRDVP